LNGAEITTPYEISEAAHIGSTPDKVELDSGTYTINVTHNTEMQTQTVEVLTGQTVRLDFQFVTPTPPIMATVAPLTVALILTYLGIS